MFIESFQSLSGKGENRTFHPSEKDNIESKRDSDSRAKSHIEQFSLINIVK